MLPQCVDVVEGVLGADLVGFHTYNYLFPAWQRDRVVVASAR